MSATAIAAVTPLDAPRWHRWALVALMVILVLRGLFWAGTTQLLSPIDELQHADYVASLAAGDGIPIVGESYLRPEIMRVAKFPHSSGSRIAPMAPSSLDDRWGPTRESYEAFQGPTYYALMAPAWWVGDRWGTNSAIYAARAMSVLLTSLSVLVAYLLARALFPRRREIWLAAPAVLAIAMGVAGNPSAISNDALVLPLSGLALLPVARAIGWGRPLTWRGGALTGLLVGLSVVTKSNCIALVPLIALGVVAAAWLQRRAWRAAIEFLAGAAVLGAATLAPWVAWNLHAYDALSANEAVDAITGFMQPSYRFGLHAILAHLRQALYGFWDMQLTAPLDNPPARALFAASAVFGIAAFVRARSDQREATGIAFVAAAFPLAFLSMLAVIFITFGGRSSVTGRHMYPAFVAVAVLLAAGVFIACGRRVGLVVLAVLAAVSLNNDIPATDRYITAAYETYLLNDLAPGRGLGVGDGLAAGGTAVVRPPCPAAAVGIVTGTDPRPALDVIIDGRAASLPIIGDLRQLTVRSVAIYQLPEPTRAPVSVTVPADVEVVTTRGRVLAEAWCRVKDPHAARFAQTFTPEHPRILTRNVVHWWPRAWYGLSLLAVAAALINALRRRPSGDGGA